MSVFRDIREGLTATLNGLGLNVYRGYWPSQITPPAALIKPVSGSYLEEFSTAAAMEWELIIAVQIGSVEQAQSQLDAFIEPDGSIQGQLLANPTLGGRVSYALARGFEYDAPSIENSGFLMATLNLEIRA